MIRRSLMISLIAVAMSGCGVETPPGDPTPPPPADEARLPTSADFGKTSFEVQAAVGSPVGQELPNLSEPRYLWTYCAVPCSSGAVGWCTMREPDRTACAPYVLTFVNSKLTAVSAPPSATR